eukprot:g6831.t1
METGVVAVGAAAIAYYVYLKTKRESSTGLSSRFETHRNVEQAPSNWTGELYMFAEALRYLYLEYITHWPTADLFIGIAYLARQGIKDFPAAEVVAHGTRINPKDLSNLEASKLKDKFNTMHRLLVYSQKLRNVSTQIPESEWADLQIGSQDFVVYHPKASVIRPAYIMVRDHVLNAFVLAIRGTHTTRDIFTSLSGAAKPHHTVCNSEVILGYSHFGMLAGARWILKHCQKFLIEAHEIDPDFKLIITGHSMGGGAAAMLTMMIREQFPMFDDTQCYTFACPGCMTLELAQSCSPYVTTLVYGTDVVPTVSPVAGDLLREEVAQSSWAKSFKQDIRSSVFVQTIEGQVRGIYRSASTWTLRQAKTVSSLTTSCTRPRSKSDIDLPLAPQEEEETLLISDNPCLSPPEITTAATSDASTSNQENEITPKKDNQKQPSLAGRAGTYLSDMWGKVSSISWKRKVSDTSTIATNELVETSGDSGGEVEGVFNTKGIEMEAMDEHENSKDEGSSSNVNNQDCKRQLYPAGTIYHLVPAYILKADQSNQVNSINTEDDNEASTNPNTTSREDAWYHPEISRNEETVDEDSDDDAFVLFSNMPQEAYSKIRVCRSMVMDHFVPRYKTAVESTLQALDAVLEKDIIQTI